MYRPNRWTNVLVALALALTLALGTVAAATASRPVTARIVKKIAAKVVRKEAARLTVANAERLGGQPPAAYVDGAVMTSASNQRALQGLGVAQTLLDSASISVPDGVHGILIEAASTFNSGNGGAGETLTIFEAVDQACSAAAAMSGHPQQAHVDPGLTASVSLTTLVPVTPGVHAVRLCALSSSSAGFATTRTLVASTVGEATVHVDATA